MNQQQSQNKKVNNEIDWNIVADYLRSQNIVISEEPLQVKPFSAGYSNLTYFIRMGEWEAVLRRPPFGPIPPKAHDMKREFDILSKLNRVFPLAPKPYIFCEDDTIMDRHFYVMEKKNGLVIDDVLPEEFEDHPNVGQLISTAVVETLVKLHEIDYKEAGLDTLGYPEGYVTRQVNSWIKRYHNCKTDEFAEMDELEKWLTENIPESPEPTIVHNDFKMNNMMFAVDNPGEVIGLFDWELSTIGDPLTDVAAMISYWKQEGELDTSLTAITDRPGFFSKREMLELYAEKSGRDVSNIDFYLTLAYYKLGVILQQIYYRWKIGEATDERFAKLIGGIENCMTLANMARKKQIL